MGHFGIKNSSVKTWLAKKRSYQRAVEKINSGVREAIDSSTIAAKYKELCDRSIMMFNITESKAGNKRW